MRGRHTAAILEMMDIGDGTARTIDEYVAMAGSLGRSGARRAELSARIKRQKNRIYRDRDCVRALEAILDRIVRADPAGLIGQDPEKSGSVTGT